MPQLYCGNNSQDAGLRNGTKTLGNRYSCLKRGIGIGLHLPLDPSANGPYSKIDKTKYYCGKARTLPAGYDRFGSLPKCQSTGVGVGKKMRADRAQTRGGRRGGGMRFSGMDDELSTPFIAKKSPALPITVFVGLAISMFLVLYFVKPRCVTKKVGKTTKIDWKKFCLYYGIVLVVAAIIAFLTSKLT